MRIPIVSPITRQRVFATGFAGTDAPMASLSYGPPVRRPAAMSSPTPLGRRKLAPDPDVRSAIVAAASKSVREQGVRGLNVAAVLEQAQLGTRAFYRHFESKDQLVAAVFLEITRAEVLRLTEKMAAAATPVEAVAAWIDGRLDLAFDEDIKLDLRRVSLEAQSKAFSSPELVLPAYAAILEPLIEQLRRGLEIGVFQDIVAATAAKSINGVVWAATQRQWATDHWERDEVRERALRFCLRGLGVAPDTIAQIVAPS
jgi:AcrR family transcriptional regulator